ncbi:MAG: glycosyltransferase family 4 protein, partial [Pirellulaceae bacterium]|nr:glycosyltransferase family 4 protein [Pirellulaceae bacterium]
MRQVSQHVAKLNILVSVPMEANRNWQADNHGLPVITQRTWTKRKLQRHPGGYTEELFVHFPVDTWSQLHRLNPDCVVSLEMGMRSIQSAIYCRLWRRRCRHVLSVYGSERSEAGRGLLRRYLRRGLLRVADVVTFNGPSCKRYLLSQGTSVDRLLPWNYAADPSKAYRGSLALGRDAQSLRMLTVSQLIPRKGVDRALESLVAWATNHPDQPIEWAIAGTGPQASDLQQITPPANLTIHWLGHCDSERLQQLYADYPINFFPTLGDEWGLVVDEALASGQVVLGSGFSQAVETLIQPNFNGGTF